jgi:hypothetical protein
MAHLVPAGVLAHLPAATRAHLLGRSFFPQLIAPPFMNGLRAAFYVSAAMSLIAAIASFMRGRHYIHGITEESAPASTPAVRGTALAEE